MQSFEAKTLQYLVQYQAFPALAFFLLSVLVLSTMTIPPTI